MPGFKVFVDKGDLLGIVVSKCDDEPLPDGDRPVNGTISDPIEQEVGSLVRRNIFIRGKPFDADERIVGLNHHGDIVESGSHEALLAKGGFYAQLYNSQFEDAG